MPKVDWSYHRTSCKTCGKTAAFLAEHDVSIKEQVDARKTPLVDADALELVRQVSQIYVTRGTKVVHLDLKRDQPDDAAILALLIGPSGKLRAPTLKLGKTLVVGFDQTTYEQVVG